MGFTESEHHSKCPCYGKGEDFQKVINLKDVGLVIYCYIDRKKNLDQTAHTDNNTIGSAIILQNTKSMKLLSAELLPELDKNKITCPRCRQILRHTQELLNKTPGIDKNAVLGICDHCRLKAQTQKPCNECGKIMQKFLSTHHKQKEDIRKYVKLWLTTIGHVLDRPHKIATRTYSEKDLNLSVLEIGISVDKLRTQPMFHSETNILKTRMPEKAPPLDLEKGVHFRESYKPAETISMTRSDSKREHVDKGKIKDKYKDAKGEKGEKLIAIQGKAQTTKKDTIQTTPKKTDTLLKSKPMEKDRETTKFKKIEKSQDNLKKAKQFKSVPAEDKKQAIETHTTYKTSEKADTMLKSEQKEKDKEVKRSKPKLLSDQAEKQFIEKEDKKRQHEEEAIKAKVKDKLTKVKEDDPLNKPLRETKAVVKLEPKRPVPKPPTNKVGEQQVTADINQIKLHERNIDDQMSKLGKTKQTVPRHPSTHELPPVDLLLKNNILPITSKDSNLSSTESYNTQIHHPAEIEGIIIGEDLLKLRRSFFPVHVEQQQAVPLLFKSEYIEKPPSEPREQIKEVSEEDNNNKVDPEARKGIIHYALSDRSFIDKGWTLLPTEKVVRKMNVYRMRPAHPEFDWFEHNKHKRCIQYDTCEKFAEFDDNGRGRWYYKNGRLALDYYDAEETNAQQRFVVYSSGEPDERGRSRPITILATFDYLGNGMVLDHAGKIRLKYNQTEGVVLDRNIGPVSHWKWHTLNDPPVLQQVMIDTQMSLKDPHILTLGGPADVKTRPDNEEMLAIEFDNFVKDKNKKLSQKFKPFQIKMKALKINEHFSLRVLDQATIYLIFRDGSTNLKLNIGMVLDHREIVDTDTAEVGEVSNNLERLPARTDSLARMQRSIAFAQQYERNRTERERRLRPSEPCASADHLVAAVSRPLRTPLRTVPLARTGSTSDTGFCGCHRKPSSNLYYNTRLT